MKKTILSLGLSLVFGLFAFAGCAAADPEAGGSASSPSGSEPSQGSTQETPSQGPQENPSQGGSQASKPQETPEEPATAPLALLDTVNVPAAFGDRTAEGWSFAMKADGDLSATYGFSLTSEIGGDEKVNVEYGAGIGLEDLFGLRSDENAASGLGLFGGGNANFSLQYRGPDKDSETVQKDFNVGFRHDGDLIWYTGKGEEESKISLSELKERTETAMMFDRMESAFGVIPEELQKGGTLRFAVEKLIDLGFTVAIDDTDGISVTLKANAGFYTDLFNDMLEKFLPAKWLNYLPRADLRYEKSVFDIKLAFDEDGIFKEYSMTSDVSLTASLEVRELFTCESVLKTGGNFSFTATADPVTA